MKGENVKTLVSSIYLSSIYSSIYLKPKVEKLGKENLKKGSDLCKEIQRRVLSLKSRVFL